MSNPTTKTLWTRRWTLTYQQEVFNWEELLRSLVDKETADGLVPISPLWWRSIFYPPQRPLPDIIPKVIEPIVFAYPDSEFTFQGSWGLMNWTFWEGTKEYIYTLECEEKRVNDGGNTCDRIDPYFHQTGW